MIVRERYEFFIFLTKGSVIIGSQGLSLVIGNGFMVDDKYDPGMYSSTNILTCVFGTTSQIAPVLEREFYDPKTSG